jgi:hypothetical protein
MICLDEHCPVSLGDSWTKARDAFGISGDPKPYFNHPDIPAGFHLRLSERGIWLFFDDTKCIRSLRFDVPFSGSVDGVRIGDSPRQVRTVKGAPPRKWPVEDGVQRWLYSSQTHPFLRFDFNPKTKRVETIFI